MKEILLLVVIIFVGVVGLRAVWTHSQHEVRKGRTIPSHITQHEARTSLEDGSIGPMEKAHGR